MTYVGTRTGFIVDVAKRTQHHASHSIVNIIPPIKQTQIVHAAQIVRESRRWCSFI